LPQRLEFNPDTDFLPLREKWNDDKTHDYDKDTNEILARFAIEYLVHITHKWKDFDNFKELFVMLPNPKIMNNDLWKTDEEFGRQALQVCTVLKPN
jgi:hypothetical protein